MARQWSQQDRLWGWLVGGGIVQHDSYECAPGVTCYPNHPLIAGGDPEAVTIGNRIFCKKDCDSLLPHERVHVDQRHKEPGFVVRYLIESLLHGTCTANRFEAPAYASKSGDCTP
jgi:hypothetical protein